MLVTFFPRTVYRPWMGERSISLGIWQANTRCSSSIAVAGDLTAIGS